MATAKSVCLVLALFLVCGCGGGSGSSSSDPPAPVSNPTPDPDPDPDPAPEMLQITPPVNVAVEAAAALTAVNLGTPETMGGTGAIQVSNDAPASGFPVGSTVVTWTATDAENESATAAQTVQVTDSTAPTIVQPADVTTAAAGVWTSVDLGQVTATDLVDAAPALTNDAPNSGFPMGTTSVTWTATDTSGNRSTTTQTVNVVDPVGDADAGAIYYADNCTGCHGDDVAANLNNIFAGVTVTGIRNALTTVTAMQTLSQLLDEPVNLADLAAFIAREKARADGAPTPATGLIPDAAACAGVPLVPVASIARRLTRFEYENSVADLLGVDIGDQLDLLPIETRPGGFSNDAFSLIVTFEHIDGFDQLATIISDRLPGAADLLTRYAACTDASIGCYDAFIRNMGERFYRAPLADEEVTRLRPLFQAAALEGDGFADGALLALRAMLQSPRFLYRTELQTGGSGGARDLNSFEVAARLSYLIWASAPDEALLARARAGDLLTSAQIVAEANRMLADSRARRVSDRLVREWFDLDIVATLDRSAVEHPGFSADIARDMHAEARALFEQIIWNDEAPLITAYNSDRTYATSELAQFYGLGASLGPAGNGLNEYQLDSATERAGLLTQGAVVAVSGRREASLVHRGLFVLNRVMCSSVQQPPAGLDTTPPIVAPGEPSRAHSEARLANAVCGGCHSQFDPLGWPFERFDGAAAIRTEDAEGNPLDGGGSFEERGVGQVDYGSAREFVDALAASPVAQDCIVIKPAQFAFGRAFDTSDPLDGCFLSDVRSRASGSTASYHDIIRSIVASEAFRTVRGDQ